MEVAIYEFFRENVFKLEDIQALMRALASGQPEIMAAGPAVEFELTGGGKLIFQMMIGAKHEPGTITEH